MDQDQPARLGDSGPSASGGTHCTDDNDYKTSHRIPYLFWGIVILISLCFLWSAFSGPHGVFSFLRQMEDATRLEKENEALLERNHALQKEIYLLGHDQSYLRRVLREELGYVGEGEDVFLPIRPSDKPPEGPPPP